MDEGAKASVGYAVMQRMLMKAMNPANMGCHVYPCGGSRAVSIRHPAKGRDRAL